jgi:GNAT superfamily N-acetyltransferase
MIVEISSMTGEALKHALPSLAELRLKVFRDYPYLYDGTLDYEKRYLRALAAAKDSIIVAAKSQDEMVGCATGSGLDGHHSEFAAPFATAGIDCNTVFYCGESVLLSPYRGLGIGHRFFDEREAHAKERGYRYSAFCAVMRPDHHPLRPKDYRPLDPFWQKRGYSKIEGMIATFSWKEIGEDDETPHPMQFWMREL